MAKTQIKFLLMFVCILGSQAAKGDECLPNLRNIAVYEGQQNIIMNLSADPQQVSWTFLPTSAESSAYFIITVGGARDPFLLKLYDVYQTGLVIKNATTTINGKRTATAGLYFGDCANNAMRTGAKLLVVRKGPECSRISSNSTSASVKCSVTFADFSLYRMGPILAWKVNGVHVSSHWVLTEKIDPNVFYAESIFSSMFGAPKNYECALTFDAPTDAEDPWIATNAPNFKESCSIRV